MIIHQTHMAPEHINRGGGVMEWRQRTLRKTIPWDKRTNTAPFYIVPDTRRYRAFEDQFDVKNKTAERERVCYNAHVDWDANVVTEDESDGT
jgi:hypothetical protein